MSVETIDQRVRSTLALALNIEVPPAIPFTRADHPVWDSLKHVEIIFMLEDEFGVQFREVEFAALDSVAAIVERVEASLAS